MKKYENSDAPASENKITSSKNEKKFISLLYACPLDKDSANCEFKQFRDLQFKNLPNLLVRFSNNEIEKMLSNHYKCLNKGIEQQKNLKKEIPNAYILWNSDIPIEKLAAILKNLNWIKSKTEFIQFFNTPAPYHNVRWNMDFKYELAYLFYKLKENNMIKIHSRAYFSIAEQSFTGYFFNKIKKNTLKKNSSKINNEPIKYIDVITNIENIINKISNN